MAGSQAIAGIGTKFLRKEAAVFVELAEVNSITGPGMSRETIDVTSLSSTGGYREKIPGLRDGGTISLSLNFRKDTYGVLKTDFESDNRQDYKIELPSGDTFLFSGLVTEIPLTIPIDDKITVDATFEISGAVTFTPSV
jgi:predicted secreted protein